MEVLFLSSRSTIALYGFLSGGDKKIFVLDKKKEMLGEKLMTDQSLFFSPDGSKPLAPSGSRLAASASSSQASRTGFKAIMLL